MAAIKRKVSAGKGEEKTKSRRTGPVEDKLQPVKKLKTSHEAASRHGKKNKQDSEKEGGETRTENVSVLREEEPLFPRGGGSVLTPLEHKQINIEAKRDVLFEQSGKSKSKSATAADGITDDDEEEASPAVARRKKQRSKRQNVPTENAPVEVGARIEGLSFSVGTSVP